MLCTRMPLKIKFNLKTIPVQNIIAAKRQTGCIASFIKCQRVVIYKHVKCMFIYKLVRRIFFNIQKKNKCSFIMRKCNNKRKIPTLT